MNKICTICSRYKDTIRCCVKGCKDDLCEDCVDFLRIVIEPKIDRNNFCTLLEPVGYVLPMCHKHAPFVCKALQKSLDSSDREKMALWLQDNINPTNPNRLMRFINTAVGNIPILY